MNKIHRKLAHTRVCRVFYIFSLNFIILPLRVTIIAFIRINAHHRTFFHQECTKILSNVGLNLYNKLYDLLYNTKSKVTPSRDAYYNNISSIHLSPISFSNSSFAGEQVFRHFVADKPVSLALETLLGHLLLDGFVRDILELVLHLQCKINHRQFHTSSMFHRKTRQFITYRSVLDAHVVSSWS